MENNLFSLKFGFGVVVFWVCFFVVLLGFFSSLFFVLFCFSFACRDYHWWKWKCILSLSQKGCHVQVAREKSSKFLVPVHLKNIYVRYNSSMSNSKVSRKTCQLLKEMQRLKTFDLDSVGSNHHITLTFVVSISSVYPQHPLVASCFSTLSFCGSKEKWISLNITCSRNYMCLRSPRWNVTLG